jgi:uncharacterized membrane protein
MSKKKDKRKGPFLKRHERMVWALIVIVPTMVLAVGYLVAPQAVWDRFLYRYYWAPIEADAVGHSVNGITESYNLIDTPTYGIVLVLALFAIYRLLKKMDIRPGVDMFMATIPYIILGSVLRVLEDSGVFTGKAVYLFISPIIYIFIGLLTLLKLVESHRIAELERKRGMAGRVQGLWLFGAILGVFNILYLVAYTLYLDNRELFSADHRNMAFMMSPAVTALVSIAAFLGLLALVRRRGRLYIHDIYAVFGWHLLALALFYVVSYGLLGWVWPDQALPSPDSVRQLHLEQLALVPLLALGATGIFAGACYGLTRRFSWMKIYWKDPVNLAIMYAHMLDASATFTALQWFSYGEKHVVPNFLIGLSGTPAVMFPLKAIVMAIVIYALSVELKPDLERNRLIQALIWIAILVLGLAPGTRDLLRLGLGV